MIDIYYIDGNGYININDAKFKNNKDFTKYLYEMPYLKMWRSDGIVIDIPKGKKCKHEHPINGVDFYYDEFPTKILLNYPVNFKIYVNDRDYFFSKLPQLNITSNYNAEWSLKNPYFQSIVEIWIPSYTCGV